MTPVCTCAEPYPEAIRTGHGEGTENVCQRCGLWWAPKHGSNPISTKPPVFSLEGNPVLDKILSGPKRVEVRESGKPEFKITIPPPRWL